MSTEKSGSCLCGKVHFQIDGHFEKFFVCHCKYCQKDSGSAFAANLFSNQLELTWISGRQFVKTFTLPNTRHKKSFCSECGSALPSDQGEGTMMVVPAGCLDFSVEIKPNAHIFMRSKANWEESLSSTQAFEGFPK